MTDSQSIPHPCGLGNPEAQSWATNRDSNLVWYVQSLLGSILPTYTPWKDESSAISTARLRAVARLTRAAYRAGGLPAALPAYAVGDLILGRASHLDAFSAYPYRTSATQRCPWRDNWHTGGPSTLVLSYWGQPPSNPLRP